MQRYPEVVTIQEQGLEAKNKRKMVTQMCRIIYRKERDKFGAFGSPCDRQERGQEGRKVQENT